MTDLPTNRNRARGRIPWAACALAAAVALLTGCATAMNGSMQRVAVASDPPGARVFIGDEQVGVTPAHLELDRRDGDLALRFEKDCYRETVLPVPRTTSGWVFGNPVLAGIPINDYGLGPWLGAMAFYAMVGGLADRRSGGAFTFPDLVRASLEPMPDAARQEESGEAVEPDLACGPAVLVGATLERRPDAPEGTDSRGADRGAPGSSDGAEPARGHGPGASRGPGDQGNTPSDR